MRRSVENKALRSRLSPRQRSVCWTSGRNERYPTHGAVRWVKRGQKMALAPDHGTVVTAATSTACTQP